MDPKEEERLLRYYNELESDESENLSRTSEASDPYQDDGEYNSDPTYKPSSGSSGSETSTSEHETNEPPNNEDKNAEYSKTPSRSELTSQLHSYLNDSDIVKSRPIQPSINLNKLIDDLVQQLKEMETIQNDRRSPRSEVEEAGKQIQTIVEIHKKLLKLKSANDYM